MVEKIILVIFAISLIELLTYFFCFMSIVNKDKNILSQEEKPVNKDETKSDENR